MIRLLLSAVLTAASLVTVTSAPAHAEDVRLVAPTTRVTNLGDRCRVVVRLREGMTAVTWDQILVPEDKQERYFSHREKFFLFPGQIANIIYYPTDPANTLNPEQGYAAGFQEVSTTEARWSFLCETP